MELGFSEIVVIALLIVVLFGPDKLPQIARDLGAGVRKMKGAVEDIKTEILKEGDNPVSEIKQEIEKLKESAKEFDPKTHLQREIFDDKKPEEPKINSSEDEQYEGPVSR